MTTQEERANELAQKAQEQADLIYPLDSMKVENAVFKFGFTIGYEALRIELNEAVRFFRKLDEGDDDDDDE